MFRNTINRNVNLLTIVGIFNALAIYANNLQNPDISSKSVSLGFLLLSIVVTFQIVFDKDGLYFTSILFRITLASCQIVLTLTALKIHSTAMFLIVIPSFINISIVTLGIFILKKIITRLKKLNLYLFIGLLFCYVITLYSVCWFVVIISENILNKYYYGKISL